VHFATNLLATVPKSHQEMVAAAFRTVFAYSSREEVHEHYEQVGATFAEHFAKASALMVEAKEEVLAFSAFPPEQWCQIWSTNPLERLNKELKKRCRVVGIFPNEDAVVRLAGAVLADVHDEWQAAERRYFSESSMAKLYAGRDNGPGSLAELEAAS
jgi:transposase-like protein